MLRGSGSGSGSESGSGSGSGSGAEGREEEREGEDEQEVPGEDEKEDEAEEGGEYDEEKEKEDSLPSLTFPDKLEMVYFDTLLTNSYSLPSIIPTMRRYSMGVLSSLFSDVLLKEDEEIVEELDEEKDEERSSSRISTSSSLRILKLFMFSNVRLINCFPHPMQ